MAMVLDFVLEKAMEALYAGIEDVIRKNSMFAEVCEDIKSRLVSLAPYIDEMGKYNNKLNRAKELEAIEGLIKQGIELVGECSKLRDRNILKKRKYTNKLLEFKESLEKELDVLKVRMARDVQKTEVAVEEMARDVKKTEVAVEDMARVVKKTEVAVDNMAKDVKKTEVAVEDMVRDVRKTEVAVDNMATDVKKAEVAVEDMARYVRKTEVAVDNMVRDVKKTEVAVEDMASDVRKTEVAVDNMARDVKKTEVAVEDMARYVLKTEVSVDKMATDVKKTEVVVDHMATDVKKTEVAVEYMARDVKKTEIAAENIQDVVHNIYSMLVKQHRYLEIQDLSAVLPDLPELIVGLEVPLEELKVKLLEDEASVLIVTAPAGCGKTTLVTKFCQDQDVKDKFLNNIFFVTFSKKPNLELIMKGLNEQTGYKIPTFRREVTPEKWLKNVELEKGDDPLLLVLDDVWSGSESLLRKFQFKMSNHKILVTSRSEFPRFGSSYHLPLLDNDNAMKLFGHTTSLGDKSPHIPEHLSKEIVKHCNGFPLTVTVVGRSLCGQTEEMWQSRVDEWSEGSSILDLKTDVLLQLQSSLDVLDNAAPKVKNCFFDLVAFPKDAKIQVTALFYMWAELYDLQKENVCIAKLYELNNRGLAPLRKPKGDTHLEAEQGAIDYSTYVVRQRDWLRKLAIYNFKRDPMEDRERLIIEICGNNFPKWWREQTHPYMNARLVSISTDGEFSVKFPNMELPEAEVLVLNFQSNTTYALPEFVERMDKLKVLLVINHSGRYIEMDNFQLLGSLSNLRSLSLDGVHFSCIADSKVQFMNLHKLHWRRAGRYDDEDPVKFSHVFPILKEIICESCEFSHFPAELCELIHLTKLEIIGCPSLSDLPEAIENLVNLEVLRLGELSDVPGSIRNLKKLKFLSLNLCYWQPESIENMVNLEELRVEELSGFEDSIGNLKNLKILIINRCYALPESIGNLVSLEVLRLEDCTDLSEIPDSIGNLKRLHFLKISNNNKLGKLPEDIGKLKCLRHLIIDRFYRLYEMPKSIGNLVNLEGLALRYCYILMELPESIRNLYKLNSLDIEACCKMEELPEHIGKLKSLRKLQMFSCNALRNLPESVSHLEKLEEVMCEDWHARELWTPLLPTLKNLRIVVWKANIHGL